MMPDPQPTQLRPRPELPAPLVCPACGTTAIKQTSYFADDGVPHAGGACSNSHIWVTHWADA